MWDTDPNQIKKCDTDPNQIEKLDTDPNQIEKWDTDPNQIEKWDTDPNPNLSDPLQWFQILNIKLNGLFQNML